MHTTGIAILGRKASSRARSCGWRGIVRGRGAHLACIVGIVAFVLVALFARAITSADPNAIDPGNRLLPPLVDSAHWMGTDQLGRDIWARLAFGARTSAAVATLSVLGALAVGVTAGVLAALVGGRFDTVLGWAINVQLSIPAIVLALAISVVLGHGMTNVILAIGITLWPQFARITRTASLRVKRMAYFEGGVAMGAAPIRLAASYVLPNIRGAVGALVAIEFAHAVVSEAALAFLGFGVEPRTPSWGTMIADSRLYLNTAPWLALVPSAALTTVAVLLTFLGDELIRER